jgi:hypothetical protein
MSKATIIQQDNAHLQALVENVEAASAAWERASQTWEADPTQEAHADALLEAERDYDRAAKELAQHVRSLFRVGYRLTLPDESSMESDTGDYTK